MISKKQSNRRHNHPNTTNTWCINLTSSHHHGTIQQYVLVHTISVYLCILLLSIVLLSQVRWPKFWWVGSFLHTHTHAHTHLLAKTNHFYPPSKFCTHSNTNVWCWKTGKWLSIYVLPLQTPLLVLFYVSKICPKSSVLFVNFSLCLTCKVFYIYQC